MFLIDIHFFLGLTLCSVSLRGLTYYANISASFLNLFFRWVQFKKSRDTATLMHIVQCTVHCTKCCRPMHLAALHSTLYILLSSHLASLLSHLYSLLTYGSLILFSMLRVIPHGLPSPPSTHYYLLRCCCSVLFPILQLCSTFYRYTCLVESLSALTP